MKIAFFKEDELATVSFQKDKDREIIVGDDENYYLYYNNGKTLEQVSAQLSDIEVTVFEIKRVIYGDIYNLLNNLLGDMDSTNVKYYLSGQSCKINLFHDLLKEFIPGKCMRLKNTASSGDLKMNCIRGSIQYLADKDSGKIQSQFVMQMPELIYRVANCSDVSHEKDVLYLNEAGEMEIIASEKPFATTYQDFKVYDQHNVLKYSFRYNIGRDPKPIGLEEGSEFVKQLLDECSLSREKLNDFLNAEVAGTRLDVDNKDNSGQVNKKMINFCLPDKSGYGFRIYTVVVDQSHNYHLLNDGNGVYYSYEPTHMEIFFDGKR